MTWSCVDVWLPGPALEEFTDRQEDTVEGNMEPTFVTCLPHAEHTDGAETNSYLPNALKQALVIEPHTAQRALSPQRLGVIWGLAFSVGKRCKKKKGIWFCWNKQTKPKLLRCFPHHRSHTKKRAAWGPSAGEPGGGPALPLARHMVVPGKELNQSEPQFLPWSNENIYGKNILSVVRNK